MTENKTKKETNEAWNSLYITTFDGIKAPYELYRKVADMKNIEKSKTNMIKKWVIAAAVALSIVFCSNLAVYAATGTGWLGRIMVSWSSEEKEVVFREETTPNGDTYYVGTIQNEKQDSLTITTKDPSVLEDVKFDIIDTDIYVTYENGERKKIEIYNQEEDFTAGLVLVTPLPEK
ncbi:MAG: hypothetical protein E7268_11890 [Lachnospiraceae bacterium]|nr:hypothetical protein [Lachnospiraceae bacterium]